MIAWGTMEATGIAPVDEVGGQVIWSMEHGAWSMEDWVEAKCGSRWLDCQQLHDICTGLTGLTGLTGYCGDSVPRIMDTSVDLGRNRLATSFLLSFPD